MSAVDLVTSYYKYIWEEGDIEKLSSLFSDECALNIECNNPSDRDPVVANGKNNVLEFYRMLSDVADLKSTIVEKFEQRQINNNTVETSYIIVQTHEGQKYRFHVRESFLFKIVQDEARIDSIELVRTQKTSVQ